MYLDKVEIHGFKSFGDLVKLQIPQGITAVIGPNGSGKSNVADAIRWVLGEQSARILRGSKMEDIIFAGTERRKPLGYAEVTMYMNNEDRALPVEYSEISVKRRIYRSGESEYFLNNSLCRLKDIQELFMDTGIGKEGYSIIGQGQMDKVLSSKPEDRRSLFEEAAGIYKYKMRKLEAEKKLDKEEENLIRVMDILSDLEERIEPLAQEAEKTKLYLTTREKLKKYDINIYLHESARLKEALEEFEKNLNTLSDEVNEITFKKEKATKSYQAFKERREELYQKIQHIVEKIAALQRQEEHLQSQIAITEEKIVSNLTIYNQILQDTQKQEQIQQEMVESLHVLERKKIGIELEHQSQVALLEEEGKKVEILFDEVKKLEETLLASRSDLYEKNRSSDRIKAEIEKEDSLILQLDTRITHVESSLAKTSSDIRHQEAVILANQKDIQDIAKKLSLKQTQSYALKEEEELFLLKQKECITKYTQCKTQLESYTRQIHWLEHLKNDYEGYYQSVKEIMKIKKAHAENWPGIIGVVSDVLTVPKSYEVAIVTALGSAMQHIVTQTEKDAKQMIMLMKQRKIGKATFLPIDTIKAAHSLPQAELIKKEKGVLGLASELVDYEKKYHSIVSNLLGRIFIIDTMENASQLARKYAHRYKLVTLEGETFHVGGSLSGGSSKNLQTNIFSRARELTTLQEALMETKKQLENLTHEKEKLQKEYEAKIKEQQRLKSQLTQLEEEQTTFLVGAHKHEESVALLKQSRQNLEDEAKSLLTQKEQRCAHKIILLENLKSVDKSQEQDQEDIQKLEHHMIKLREESEAKREILTQQKIQVSTTLQNIEHIQMQIKDLKQNMLKAAEQSQDNTHDIDKLTNEKKTLEETILTHQEAIKILRKQIVTAQDEKNAGELENQQMAHEAKLAEENVQNLVVRLENLKEENYRLQHKKDLMLLEKKKQSDAIWQNYELTYSGCLLYKENLGDIKTMQKELEILKSQIKGMGNINVNAVDAYDEATQRYTFLSTQKEDIEKAEEALRELIEKLQLQMHEIFKEQFGVIAKYFTEVFEELFGGGRAFLQLTDETNILESGIEIIAQPPGKKLQNMSLLSGGERALTAIALLFAILKINPSPFCVLDEIEAALDDANVLRFSKYLNNLSKDTQFLVITHRKGTMEQADTLYGVTMQERGVSTVLSIKLEEATSYINQKTN